MGGGLMQLVAYGAQDIYLTGNPQITFFKVVYRRHTNFAVESIEQTFNGSADFGKRVTATISRNGDLIQQMYLELSLPLATTDSGKWTYGVGNAIVQKAEIEIGGQLIDRHYGEWMNIWTELSTPAGKRDGYDNMVGNATSDVGQIGGLSSDAAAKKLYVPFQFWFNRNPGLALPLIALQYHEVKLNLELRQLTELLNGGTVSGSPSLSGGCKLYVDYVYLDTDERRRFAQVSHEYLIEQVQFTGDETVESSTTKKNFTLNFNHPVKELVWVHVTSTNATNYRWFNFGNNSTDVEVDSFTSCKIQLNGHDRFSERDASYFRKVQNYEHHTRVPRTPTLSAGGLGSTATVVGTIYTGAGVATATVYNNPYISASGDPATPAGSVNVSDEAIDAITDGINIGYGNGTAANDRNVRLTATVSSQTTLNANLAQYIYTYAFALSPEEHQPSGTCNFSRIDNAVLQLDYTGTTAAKNLKVFAVNYNVLRIMSGMGGLAYSN